MITNYIMEHTKFFRNFMSNWKQTGSIAPSSKFLAEKMLKDIDFENARIIIEMGTGTGSITKHILNRMHSKCVLITFETNKDFYDFAKNSLKDNRLMIVNDSVLNLKKHLQGIKVDYIVSGIPLAHLNSFDKNYLLKEVKNSLNDSGSFIQFQYSVESYKKLKTLFPSVKINFSLLGIPPAFIYTCKN